MSEEKGIYSKDDTKVNQQTLVTDWIQKVRDNEELEDDTYDCELEGLEEW